MKQKKIKKVIEYFDPIFKKNFSLKVEKEIIKEEKEK